VHTRSFPTAGWWSGFGSIPKSNARATSAVKRLDEALVTSLSSLSETSIQMVGKMRRMSLGGLVAVSGLLVGWAGQAIWKNSPDSLWAAVLVVSMLSALTIALNPTIARLLAPITGGQTGDTRPHG
jgi:hypothetical protein